MATIGTFKKTGTEYTGEIFTLSLQAKGGRALVRHLSSSVFEGCCGAAFRSLDRQLWAGLAATLVAIDCPVWAKLVVAPATRFASLGGE